MHCGETPGEGPRADSTLHSLQAEAWLHLDNASYLPDSWAWKQPRYPGETPGQRELLPPSAGPTEQLSVLPATTEEEVGPQGHEIPLSFVSHKKTLEDTEAFACLGPG